MRRLSRSYQEQNINSIAEYRMMVVHALRFYYSSDNPEFNVIFANKTIEEIQRELRKAENEVDLQSSLALLSVLEARFRIDYAIRCEKRYKDELSRRFRELHKHHGFRAHLENDIFNAWEVHAPGMKGLISELRQAFKYRHWLAHGRYWLLKVQIDRFDFQYLYSLTSMASTMLVGGT